MPICTHCGFNLKNHEQGDGPAFFGILLVGTLSGVFAAIVEVKYAPPLWLHAAIWIPFIIIGALLSIRLFKAMLVAAQYRLRSEDFGQRNDNRD